MKTIHVYVAGLMMAEGDKCIASYPHVAVLEVANEDFYKDNLCDEDTIKGIEEFEIKKQVKEAQAYLEETEWVESYIIKHLTGVEVLPENSNKLAIAVKREEARAFLRDHK